MSEKVLADRLRTLTAHGLIDRTLISATPPHVIHSPNERGRSLIPALRALHDRGRVWAADQGHVIEEWPTATGAVPPGV
ncbi:MAG: winged helix-turn-helix transcriptional regulator [Thermoleophilia bacterium]|nr:winged helix-turn-helix transcriptional regulator [Thermoleophilia bacterium]